MTDSLVVLFDGECVFCNRQVRFIIARDPKKRFSFASLGSEAGQRILRERGFDPVKTDSIVLIAGDRTFIKSTAVLKIASRLTFPWWLFSAFLVVPRFIRDACYDAFARRRYRWFGKYENCPVPSPAERSRFLDFQG